MNEPSDLSSPCRTCRNMVCRSRARDCYDVRDDSLQVYQSDKETLSIAHAASALVDRGRAGTLNRIEEIIEYCHERNFHRVGVAYCFSVRNLALELCGILETAGLAAYPVSCTSGAVLEREIDPGKEGETVSCNPAGQALVLNRIKPDLAVEMGLCLGHDMIFHQTCEIPVTVLLVKDRTVAHHPASLFTGYTDSSSAFLKALDDGFAMQPPAWLADRMEGEGVSIVDVRSVAEYERGHIQGSVSLPLRELPDRFRSLDRKRDIVCVCNGGVQSAYAVMFLASRGFRRLYNLTGGFSRWEREGRPVTPVRPGAPPAAV